MTHMEQSSESEAVKTFLRENFAFLEPDPEIMRNHHLAPRSSREHGILEKETDNEAYSELRSVIQAGLDEAYEIAEKTVATPAAQCGDMACAIFTAAGDVSLMSFRGVHGFAATLHYPIRFIRKYFADEPTVGVKEGDGFVINDCRYGGVHSPDQHLFMPVFYEGELICWTCCAMHEGEVGAKVPGGMGPTIESKWDEGFKGSPIKIVEGYCLKLDLVTLLQNNSREPQIIYADLKARLSACRRLEKKIHECIEAYGVDAVIGFLRSDLENVRDEAARRLRELPDSTTRISMYVDTTMREPGLLRVNFALKKKGDRMTIDMRGTSPQLANRPINSLMQSQALASMIAMCYYVWPDLPPIQAMMDNFDVVTDPETLVDCDNEVPTALCMQPMFKAITCVELLFSKLYYGMPHRYTKPKAGWFNQPQSIIYGGITQHFDSVGNMCGDLNGMAGGAKYDGDGEHSMTPQFGTYTDIGESEVAEQGLPYIYAVSKRLVPDNCGFGKYRGGAAYQYGLIRFGSQPFGFQTYTGGSFYPSTFGLFGGYACPVYAACRIRGKNLFEVMKERPEVFDNLSIEHLMNKRPIEGVRYEALPMAVPFELYPEGELFMICQGAGGGYGDALERDPESVMTDVEEGIISHRTAREIYHVVYDEKTLVVDQAATKETREKERKARKARGMEWDTFVKTSVRDVPPEGVQYFGSWNDSTELYAGGSTTYRPGEVPPVYMQDPLVVENEALREELRELQGKSAD